jgi:hypothetical protein
MSGILTGALFMFIFKETSRNAFNNDRCDEGFEKNYYRHFNLRLPHPDTIDDVIRVLPPDSLEELKAVLVGGLIGSTIYCWHIFDGFFFAIKKRGTITTAKIAVFFTPLNFIALVTSS